MDPNADTLTLVLRVLAAASPVLAADGSSGMTRNDVVSFLSLSFAAHQATRDGRRVFAATEVTAVLADLLRTGLATEDTGILALTELGRLAGAGMVTARTVLRLADFLSVVPPRQLNRAVLICAAQATEELDAIQVPTNARGWQKERGTYGRVLYQQGAGAALDRLLQGERGVAIRRIKRAVGCLLWMDGANRSEIDAALTRHLPARDAAAAAQAAASRTRDVIDTVLQVTQLKHPTADLSELSERLPVQLELGSLKPSCRWRTSRASTCAVSTTSGFTPLASPSRPKCSRHQKPTSSRMSAMTTGGCRRCWTPLHGLTTTLAPSPKSPASSPHRRNRMRTPHDITGRPAASVACRCGDRGQHFDIKQTLDLSTESQTQRAPQGSQRHG